MKPSLAFVVVLLIAAPLHAQHSMGLGGAFSAQAMRDALRQQQMDQRLARMQEAEIAIAERQMALAERESQMRQVEWDAEHKAAREARPTATSASPEAPSPRCAPPVAGWYVVTEQSASVAGPFLLVRDCTEIAQIMAAKLDHISDVCQVK